MQTNSTAAILVALISSSLVHASPIDEVRAAAARTRESLTQAQAAYDKLATATASPDDTLLHLNLKDKDGRLVLRLDLHAQGNRGFSGAAYSPTSKWIHRVDAESLTLSKNPKGTRITGSVAVHIVTADDIGPRAEPSVANIKLDINIEGGTLSGSFSTDRLLELNRVPAGVVEDGTTAPAPVVVPRPERLRIEDANSATVYLLCQAWEQHALQVGSRMRAMKHGRMEQRHPLDLLAKHPVRIPLRPLIGKSSTAPAPAKPDKAAVAVRKSRRAISRMCCTLAEPWSGPTTARYLSATWESLPGGVLRWWWATSFIISAPSIPPAQDW